jgi:hypothetical protein
MVENRIRLRLDKLNEIDVNAKYPELRHVIEDIMTFGDSKLLSPPLREHLHKLKLISLDPHGKVVFYDRLSAETMHRWLKKPDRMSAEIKK